MRLVILILLILGVSVFSKPQEDRVYSVPDMANFTDFEFYSGYLNITGKQRYLHYVFVESQNCPETDPLVIWFNGGPGCSSMLGFAQENGPYVMPDGDPNFYKNPHSWNTNASVLYIESPAGVGYSYFEGRDKDYFNDSSSAEDNYEALVQFYAKFPEYVNHTLFISGESYAGIYVPYLAYEILKHNHTIPLAGIIVGNGVTNWTYDCDPAFIDMGFWHNLYTFNLQERIESAECKFPNFGNDTEECEGLRDEFYDLIEKVNPYDVYRECYYTNESDRIGVANINGKTKTYKRGMTMREYTPFAFRNNKNGGIIPPCVYGEGTSDYFNRQDVRDALNIKTDQEWELCTDRIDYNQSLKASYWIYPYFKPNNIRVLHFSGNADGSVPTQGTRTWINTLGWNITKPYRPFYIRNRQVGGYVVDYDGLTFTSIQGVGHMAAQWSPEATKRAVFDFINNKTIGEGSWKQEKEEVEYMLKTE